MFPSLVLKEIFENLEYKHKTLYACTQVNSEWFHEASPILWQDPFLNRLSKAHLVIKSYFQEMSSDDKKFIEKYYDILPSTPLLSYSSYLKYIDIDNFINAVIKFCQ